MGIEDDNYNKIENIPNKWNGIENVISLHFTAHKDDTTWVLSQIIKEVDKGSISTRINIKPSSSSVDIDIILEFVLEVASKKIINSLLEDIRNYLKKQWKRRQKRKRLNDHSEF